MVCLWLFALGSAVGSFLNVVIYRLPAGLSLNRPGSHCPKCKHPIRWSDNLPILGWIALGGRCRDCRQPISARYPAVEAATACLFLLVGAVEGLSHGGALPLETYELAALVVFHLWLLCVLLAAAMIEYDGHRPPWRLFAPALVVGLVGMTALPVLRPIGVWPGLDGLGWRLMSGPVGLVIGAWLGWAVSRHVGQEEYGGGLIGAGACVGLFLGWQALGVLLIATATLQWIGRFAGPVRRVPPIAWMAVGALGWILWVGTS